MVVGRWGEKEMVSSGKEPPPPPWLANITGSGPLDSDQHSRPRFSLCSDMEEVEEEGGEMDRKRRERG